MYGAQNIKFERILVMKKFEFDDDLKIVKNSSMLAEHISTSGVERLYHNKELNRYLLSTEGVHVKFIQLLMNFDIVGRNTKVMRAFIKII